MALCTGVSGDNDGVNELAIKSTERTTKSKSYRRLNMDT